MDYHHELQEAVKQMTQQERWAFITELRLADPKLKKEGRMARKKPGPPRLLDTADPRLTDVIKRLKSGTTCLAAESTALGFSNNGPLRRALREKLGETAYEALIQQNAQARREAVGKIIAGVKA